MIVVSPRRIQAYFTNGRWALKNAQKWPARTSIKMAGTKASPTAVSLIHLAKVAADSLGFSESFGVETLEPDLTRFPILLYLHLHGIF